MQNIHQTNTQKFGKIRNFFWPIYRYELKKLIPMFLLFFLISFAYNILRNMKISLIITAKGAGAEVIPFLKIGAALPGALLFTYIFTKLINRFNREQVFYAMLSGFLIYFALFLFVLYPHHKDLQLDYIADFLQANVFTGEGFSGLIAVIRHLNLTFFYVLAEMWSAVVLSVLFWGFANEVTKVHEAKRFYAIFALGANCSGVFSAFFATLVKSMPFNSALPFNAENQWVFYQLIAVLVLGIAILSLFYWLNRSVFHLENVASLQIPKKAHEKLSLKECFKYLRQSRYLAYIVIMVVAYNVVFNLADVMWTEKVKQTYVNSLDVNDYMNQITSVISIIAVFFSFIVSGNVIRHYGWTASALITPIIWLVTGVGFFTRLLFEGSVILDAAAAIISNPANFVLFLGSIQICFGRACKYTVFDGTKEIAFIPLSKDNQRKGKAIVDGLAAGIGKSGGSLIYIVLFMLCGNIVNTIPYVSVIIFLASGFWIYAVYGLGKMVNESIDQEIEGVIDERFEPT